jgi:hypothetical protein
MNEDQMIGIGESGWRPTEVHPLAALFPMLEPEDLESLAQHIKEHGLQNPIVIDDNGVLIDGRMRLAACDKVGVEPRYQRLKGGDPEAYIWGANGQRRQMTKGQKAMIAAMSINENYGIEMPTNRQLAKLAGVSPATMDKAIIVRDHRHDLAEQVITGVMQLNAAHDWASQAKRNKEWLENGLAMLREEDADLAHRVTEGELSLEEARDELDDRKRELEAVRDSTFLGISTLTRAAANLEKSSGLKQLSQWLSTQEGLEQLHRYFRGGIPELGEQLEAARRGIDALIASYAQCRNGGG